MARRDKDIDVWRDTRRSVPSLLGFNNIWDEFFPTFSFDPFFRRSRWSDEDSPVLNPLYDVCETDTEYVLCVDMPGVRKEEVNVEASGNQLTVKGERHTTAEEGRREAHRIFHRTLTLPSDVDADDITADLENGVLEVHIPKSEKSTTRKIQIGSGKSDRKQVKERENRTTT